MKYLLLTLTIGSALVLSACESLNYEPDPDQQRLVTKPHETPFESAIYKGRRDNHH